MATFWPPFSQKKTSPAAERSVLRGGMLDNMACPQKNLFLGPDSPVPGVQILPLHLCPEIAFSNTDPFVRNLYFYSVLGRIQPMFEKAPKMPKTHLPESLTI